MLIVWHRWNSCLGRTPHIQVQGHKSKTRGVYFITFISIVGYTSERALMSLPHSHDAEWLKIQLLMVKRLTSCLSFFFASLHQLEFSPQTLCCYGKQLCTIPRDAAYFSYQNRYGGEKGRAIKKWRVIGRMDSKKGRDYRRESLRRVLAVGQYSENMR